MLDRSPSSTWDTETYVAGNLGKAGVGIAVDAKPRVAARQIRVDTPTPGWSGSRLRRRERRLAAGDASTTRPGCRSARSRSAERRTRVNLDTAGKAFRWYLVWIETLRARPGEGRDQRDLPLPS